MHGVTCISDRQAIIFKRHYKKSENIEVILNGPDLKRQIESDRYLKLKEEYNCNHVIVYGGALKINKAIAHVLDASKFAREKYINIKFSFIGSFVGADTW
jgi:hypothetical protein